MRRKRYIFLVAFSLFFAACASLPPGGQAQPTAYPPPLPFEPSPTPLDYPAPPTPLPPPYPEPATQTPIASPPAATPTIRITSTALVTPTHTPSPSATLRFSPTPTPLLYALSGTPLPPNLPPITAGSAAAVSALAEWRAAAVTDMTFTPDGADLAVADGTNVILYHTLSRQEAGLLTPRNPGLREIAIAPNGSWLVAGSLPGYQAGVPSTYLERWRGPEWRPAGVFAVSPLGLSDLAFRPDGWELAVSYSDPDESKNQVDLWDLFTWGISSTLTPGAVLDLAYSPDGALLALSPDRYAVNVWDLSDLAKPLYTVHTSFTGAINDLTFSPDGSLLATGGYDGEIRLYDAQSGNLALVIPGDAAVGSMAFSPDGSLIASGGIYDDSLVRLWDARSGALLRTLEGHRSGVSELQFSPDSRMLASASYDGTLRLWGIRP